MYQVCITYRGGVTVCTRSVSPTGVVLYIATITVCTRSVSPTAVVLYTVVVQSAFNIKL